MANYALIKNGVVINVIVCDPSKVNKINFGVDLVVQSNSAGVGDLYNSDTQIFSRSEPLGDGL